MRKRELLKLIFFRLFFLASILSSCRTTNHYSNNIADKDYEVYSEIINNELDLEQNEIFIDTITTNSGRLIYDVPLTPQIIETYGKETILKVNESYRKENNKIYPLDVKRLSVSRYKCLNNLDSISNPNKLFPIVSFTKPSYSDNNLFCLVHVNLYYSTPNLGGGGTFYIYEKSGLKWKKVFEKILWVS